MEKLIGLFARLFGRTFHVRSAGLNLKALRTGLESHWNWRFLQGAMLERMFKNAAIVCDDDPNAQVQLFSSFCWLVDYHDPEKTVRDFHRRNNEAIRALIQKPPFAMLDAGAGHRIQLIMDGISVHFYQRGSDQYKMEVEGETSPHDRVGLMVALFAFESSILFQPLNLPVYLPLVYTNLSTSSDLRKALIWCERFEHVVQILSHTPDQSLSPYAVSMKRYLEISPEDKLADFEMMAPQLLQPTDVSPETSIVEIMSDLKRRIASACAIGYHTDRTAV